MSARANHGGIQLIISFAFSIWKNGRRKMENLSARANHGGIQIIISHLPFGKMENISARANNGGTGIWTFQMC